MLRVVTMDAEAEAAGDDGQRPSGPEGAPTGTDQELQDLGVTAVDAEEVEQNIIERVGATVLDHGVLVRLA